MKVCFIIWDKLNRGFSFIGQQQCYDDYCEVQYLYPDYSCIFNSKDVSPLWGEIAETGQKMIPIPVFLGKIIGCINKLWDKIPLRIRNKKGDKIYAHYSRSGNGYIRKKNN